MRVPMSLSPRVLALTVFFVAMLVMGYEVYRVDKARREVWGLKPTPAAPTVRRGRPEGALTLGQLGKLHLMGIKKAPKPPKQAAAAAANVNVKLELVGIVQGGPNGRDSAFIVVAGRESKRYYVGDAIEGVAVLMSVESDRVMLKRGESLEALKYTAGESSPLTAVQTAPAPTPSAPVSVTPQGTNANEAPAPGKALTARERLRLRGRLQQQPAPEGN